MYAEHRSDDDGLYDSAADGANVADGEGYALKVLWSKCAEAVSLSTQPVMCMCVGGREMSEGQMLIERVSSRQAAGVWQRFYGEDCERTRIVNSLSL